MLAALTCENYGPRYAFRWGEVSWMELQIYNLRHVQHGAAQINLILRQKIHNAPRWAGGTLNEL